MHLAAGGQVGTGAEVWRNSSDCVSGSQLSYKACVCLAMNHSCSSRGRTVVFSQEDANFG